MNMRVSDLQVLEISVKGLTTCYIHIPVSQQEWILGQGTVKVLFFPFTNTFSVPVLSHLH